MSLIPRIRTLVSEGLARFARGLERFCVKRRRRILQGASALVLAAAILLWPTDLTPTCARIRPVKCSTAPDV
jgi:hypothetical protein